MIFRLFKKAIVALFTDNPYMIKPFGALFNATGEPVDRPETLSAIFDYQQGNISAYHTPFIINNTQISYRSLGNRQRFIPSGIFKAPDRYVYSLSNAGILGQMGLVYDMEKRCLIDESAKDWTSPLKQSPYANALNLPSKTRLGGLTLSFLTLGADGGFYHFLFESLVKTGMLQSLLKSADHLLFNAPPLDWKLKWIDKAGIDRSKITWVDHVGHYECEQLIFTNRLVADQQISKWCVDTLKEIFDAGNNYPAVDLKKIVWISRQGQHTRNIEWEDELLKFFPDIESVDFTMLPAADTILKLQEATHVIGPHGAGLSNLYLCKPGTKVLEVFPDSACFQPCYSRLSNVCGFEHSIVYIDFKNKAGMCGFDFLKGVLTKFIC
jgi:hypothetical protein